MEKYRVGFEMYKGKKILIQDVSNSKDVKFNIRTFRETESIIKQQPPKSVLLVTNVEGAVYNREAAQYLKEFSANITPYIKASATAGVTGLKRVLVQTLVKISKREIKICSSVEEAKDWLVEQDDIK